MKENWICNICAFPCKIEIVCVGNNEEQRLRKKFETRCLVQNKEFHARFVRIK